MYVFVYTDIHIYIHIYVHTHIYTYIHTYIRSYEHEYTLKAGLQFTEDGGSLDPELIEACQKLSEAASNRSENASCMHVYIVVLCAYICIM
jgi:hypothetical protein